MRINAFITWEPMFSILDAICNDPKSAVVTELNASNFYINQNLSYVNIYSNRIQGNISDANELLTDVNSSFDTSGKDEVCYGLRLVNNRLSFTSLLYNNWKDILPTGSRLILIKPVNLTSVYQWYKDFYDTLTANELNDREAIRKRTRLFCNYNETLTHSEIEIKLNSVLAEVEAEFSFAGASSYQYFNKDTLLTGTVPETSEYQARIINF